MHAIPLDSIVHLEDISIEIASQYQSRPLVEQHVKNLMLIPADELPPITVVQRQQGNVLIDGAHRVERARRLDEKMINAEFLEISSDKELIKRAYTANQTHGLPDKMSRRVDFALWLIQSQGLSYRDAAMVAKCDQSSITRRKQKLKEQEADLQPVENEHLKPLKRFFKAIEGLNSYDDSNMFADIRHCLGIDHEAIEDLYEAMCDVTHAYWNIAGR